MRGNGNGFFPGTEVTDTRLPQVVASATATAALMRLRDKNGPQVIVLGDTCAAVTIAHVHNREGFYPPEHHVALGTVARCLVYADIRTIEFCPHETLVLDLHGYRNGGGPLLITRPESPPERQQRVLCAQPRRRA